MPQEDKFLTTRAELQDTIAMTLGGRAAEEIVFGEITTGASNDLEKVTATAKQMVMRFGMSEKLGPRVFGHDHGQPFLGREFSTEPDYSDEIAREIDEEIRRIVESAHQRAKDILNEHRESLETISQILVKRETIEKDEFEALLAGKTEEDVFGPDDAAEPPSCPGARRAGRPREPRRAAAAAAPGPRRRRGPRPRLAREARAGLSGPAALPARAGDAAATLSACRSARPSPARPGPACAPRPSTRPRSRRRRPPTACPPACGTSGAGRPPPC